MKHWIVLLLLSGCGSSDPELEVTTAPEGKQTDGPQGPPPPGMMGPPHGGPGAMDLDQGQQHPPIPETDPAREDWGCSNLDEST